jgi:hypothetical protein
MREDFSGPTGVRSVGAAGKKARGVISESKS